MQHDDISQTIADAVRAGRKESGLTRKQLAATAGVSERYLHELENGAANASVGILAKVAAALGRDLVSLVAPVGRPTRPLHSLHPDFAALLATMSPAEQMAVTPVLVHILDERRRARRGVALFGLRGAGKTTLGRLLAERHAVPFVSITREIETRAGMSLTDLFNLGGPDAYRSVENEVARELAGRKDRIVLETAGGIVGNSEALSTILPAYRTVWLKASPEEHLARVIQQGDLRPIDGNPRALEHLKALLTTREPEYSRAEFVLDTSGRTVEDCLAELEQIAGAPSAATAS